MISTPRVRFSIACNANLPGRFALQAIEKRTRGVDIIRCFEVREIAGYIVSPDGFLEVVVRFFRHLLLQNHRPFDNSMKVRIGFDRSLTEGLDQVTVGWRIKRYNGPQKDQNDDNKSPKIISIHEGSGDRLGFAIIFGDLLSSFWSFC